MPWLSRLSRLTLACLLLCSGAWVAMPAVQLLMGGGTVNRLEPPRSPPLDRRTSDPPRHVIREEPPQALLEKASSGGAAGLPAWPSDIDLSAQTAVTPPSPPPSPLQVDPLPPLPAVFSRRPPALDATYRSTVEMPPPPLLDAQAPPPLSVARPQADSRPRGVETRLPSGVPHEYVVRDGDDLTSIAVKFYGNPAAAEAIWSANRDRLADPKILPIGLAIQLPTPGSAGLPSGRRDRVIEPL